VDNLTALGSFAVPYRLNLSDCSDLPTFGPVQSQYSHMVRLRYESLATEDHK